MTVKAIKSTNHIVALLSIVMAALFMPFSSVSQDMYGITVYREFPGQRAQVFSKTFQNISQLKLELDAVKRKYTGDTHNYNISTVSDGKRQSPQFINNITWVMKHDGAVKYLKSQPAIPTESSVPTVYTAYQCANNGKEIPKTTRHRDLTYSYFERISGMDNKIGDALFYDLDTAKSKAERHFNQSVPEYGDSIFYEVIVFKGTPDSPTDSIYSNSKAFEAFQAREQEKHALVQRQARIDSISNSFPERLQRIAPPTDSNLPQALAACIDVVDQDTIQLSDPDNLILLEHALRSFIETSTTDEEIPGKIYDDVNFANLFFILSRKDNIADRYSCFQNIMSAINDSYEKHVKPTKKDTKKESRKDSRKGKEAKKDKKGK